MRASREEEEEAAGGPLYHFGLSLDQVLLVGALAALRTLADGFRGHPGTADKRYVHGHLQGPRLIPSKGAAISIPQN